MVPAYREQVIGAHADGIPAPARTMDFCRFLLSRGCIAPFSGEVWFI
jgi:hypothetical protein